MKKPIIIEIIILTFVFAIIFSGAIFAYSKIFVEPNVYTIEFSDIDGITKGSPVRFMGIIVGHVRNLKTKDKNIQVQIIITHKDMKIPNGTVARVEFYGLGGSKSIELMPPDDSCDVGILTSDTIRLADVAREAQGIVEILEMIDKYVKGINKENLKTFLNTVKEAKNDNMNDAENNFEKVYQTLFEKSEKIRLEQKEITNNIKNMNLNLERINKFIKK